MDTRSFETKKGWLEEGFRSTESLVTDGDDLSVRKFITLFQLGRGSSGLDFLFVVKSNVAEFFLDVTDDFTFSSGGVSVTTFSENLHEVVGQVTTSQVKTNDGVRKLYKINIRERVGRLERNERERVLTA